MVSSVAAVCFDCLLEVVWLATNTARLGLDKMVRNHDPLAAAAAERPSLATRRPGSGRVPISNLPAQTHAHRSHAMNLHADHAAFDQ